MDHFAAAVEVSEVAQVHVVDQKRIDVVLTHDACQLKQVQALGLKVDAREDIHNIDDEILNRQTRYRKQRLFWYLVAFYDRPKVFFHASLDNSAMKIVDVIFNVFS